MPVEAAEFNFDKAHAVFDKAADDEDAFGKFVRTVCGVGGGRFFGKVEGFEVFGFHEADGSLEHFVVGADVFLAFVVFGGKVGVELGAEGDLAGEIFFRNVFSSGRILETGSGVADG